MSHFSSVAEPNLRVATRWRARLGGLLSLLLAFTCSALAQQVEWTRIANRSQSSDGTELSPSSFATRSVTDAQGNTYTWQTIAGPTTIGSTQLTTTPNRTDPRTGQVQA